MIKYLFLLTLVIFAQGVDYCETLQAQSKVYIQANQSRVIGMHSLLRGFDLDIKIDAVNIAKIYSSFETVFQENLQITDFQQLKSIDVYTAPTLIGAGKLGLLAVKDTNKDVGVWVGDFRGYEMLPKFGSFKVMTIPDYKAVCFDLKIINQNGYAVLNCQSIPQTQDDDQFDIFCVIKPEDTQLSFKSNCKKSTSLFSSIKRRSEVLKVDGRTFYLSLNNDINNNQQAVNYVSIYYLNSQNQLVFNNIIDGNTVKTPLQFDVSDLVIIKDGTIVLAETALSRLILLGFSVDNEVQVKKIVQLQVKPLALFYQIASNSLFLGTRQAITQHRNCVPGDIISKYELDPADNIITQIQANDKVVTFTTKNNNLFIYQKQQNKINYLLDKVSVTDNIKWLLSPQTSFFFTFDNKKANGISIAQPYLVISGVQKDQKITVTATSTKQVCQSILNVVSINNISSIVNKKTLDGQKFMVDPTTGLSIKLDDYFGGANLRYNLPKSANNDDFSVSIQQLNTFQVFSTFDQIDYRTIVGKDSMSFYYIGINTQTRVVYVDLCTKGQGQITCVAYWVANIPFSVNGSTVQVSASRRRSSGTVFVWSHKNTGICVFINLQNKSLGGTIFGDSISISSIKISQSYVVLVSKKYRRIALLFQNDPYFYSLQQDKFTENQLKIVEQYYPRQVILDEANSNFFFVKFPTRIVKFVILADHTVKLLGVAQDYKQYILDSKWSPIQTESGYLTLRDNTIKQQFFNPAISQMNTLQSISLNSDFTYNPLIYDQYSTLSLLVGTNNTSNQKKLRIIKGNSGSLDSQYLQATVTGNLQLSGNWILQTGQDFSRIHFVNANPILKIQSHLPEDKYKDDIVVTLTVQSSTTSQTTDTGVEAVNFPISIKDNPIENVLRLPYTANNTQIDIKLGDAFSGSISSYSLKCPYCDDGKIVLNPNFVVSKTLQQLNVYDYASYDDKILALSNKQIHLININGDIMTTGGIVTQGICKNMVVSKDLSIYFYCVSQKGQSIVQYSISNKNKFIFQNQYPISKQALIRQFDQMFVYSKNTLKYLFILDNDQSIDSNNKISTVKCFDLATIDLKYVGQWSSKSFGTQKLLPINDFDIFNDEIFVTIGNYGIGYGKLLQDGTFYTGSYRLNNRTEIVQVFLDNSFFKQVHILSKIGNDLNLLLTLTNSLSIVVTLVNKGNDYEYKTVTQTYNRYGTQRLLNWHAITDNSLFLSYYNDQSEQVSIVMYHRAKGTKPYTTFKQAIVYKLSKFLIQYHEAFLVNQNKIMISHLSEDPTQGYVQIYSIYNDYKLKLTYKEPGSFSQIAITASNSYTQATHMQNVKFDSKPTPVPDEDGGVKWYIVVIVAAVVLIVVGVAYGMFKYLKKRKDQKSVSLLTEQQQNDSDDDPKQKKKQFQNQIQKQKQEIQQKKQIKINETIQEQL